MAVRYDYFEIYSKLCEFLSKNLSEEKMIEALHLISDFEIAAKQNILEYQKKELE